jgi:hypothetical protein
MGAHALGAAAYAANAAGLADPDRPEAVKEEIRWQLEHMSAGLRAALRPSTHRVRTPQVLSGQAPRLGPTGHDHP